jgi:sugar phosphate isomerase/epimerase
MSARPERPLKVSVPDWMLGLTSNPEAVAMAQNLGFDGVEIALGKRPVNGHLAVDDDDTLTQYIDQWRTHQIGLVDVCLDILHVNCLMNDELARRWTVDGIRIANRLGVKVMLIPCAFQCGPVGRQIDDLGDVLRELAPDAEKAGVTFGIEDFLAAEDNVRVMNRARSDAVKVFYDVGNSDEHGYDVVREIRRLGRERICMLHLKDGKNFLGEGRIDFPQVIRAIRDIGYQGYLSLETPIPNGPMADGMRRNLAYIRALLGD